MKSSAIRIALLLGLTTPLTGCGLGYYGQIISGGLASLGRARPISQVLDDPAVPESTKAKLRFVQELRQFGIDEIGQSADRAFTTYDDDSAVSTDGAVAYSLSAAKKDSFTPYTWDYPFIGRAEYRGFFKLEDAQAERDALDAQGYDTALGRVSGFSTLGILSDPLRASQIALDDPDLAELILHELSHSTVYKNGDTPFNETMASFVGRSAARRFWRTRRPPDSPESRAAFDTYDDEDVIDEFITLVYTTLDAYYHQPIPSDEKIAGRQSQFDQLAARFESDFRPRLKNPDRYAGPGNLRLNNAIILGAYRYRGNLEIYVRVLARLDANFPALWNVLREAARQPDSFAYLEQWLGP